MDKNNIIFKPGEKVSCIGDDLHIECTIVSDDGGYKVKVEDTLTGRHVYIVRDQIDYDRQYYRNKTLENLLK